MKLWFALAVLMFTTVPALATEIPNEQLNNYYKSCVNMSKSGDNFKSPKAQETMCACTAAQMKTGMTLEDVDATKQQNEAGRMATNKMIVNVYAPCIQYPAYDYYYGVCISDPRTANMSKNPQSMCSCLAGKVAAHLQQNGKQVFTDILTRTPYITDPMQALTNDPQFDQFAQAQLLSCVQ